MKSIASLCTVVFLAGCGNNSQNTATSVSPADTEAMTISKYQILTREKILSSVKDPDSVKFRDVRAFRVPVSGGVSYGFCGKMNAKNAFGGYTGYERFVANPGIVGTEGNIAGFSKVWATLCDPKNDAGPVGF